MLALSSKPIKRLLKPELMNKKRGQKVKTYGWKETGNGGELSRHVRSNEAESNQ
jgi:hypothetical protein